jgi:putative membrane protein
MHIRSTVTGSFCLSLLVAAGTAYAASLSNADRQFLMTATKGDMREVQEGQMAENQASSACVKDLARTLVQDHNQNYQQLSDLAAKSGVSLPKGTDTANDPTMRQLTGVTGPAFDRQFAHDEVATHRQVIAEFKHEAEYGQDPDVKAFAAQTIPVLEKHLRMAEECAKTAGR